MNYNYLLYFSVLAQTEHYTTAAARLGISQPALSSAIHNLENSLGGVRLFEKVGRNIRLTEEGRFYQQTVDESITKLHSASLLLRDSRSKAPVVIRMGVVSGTLDGILAREMVKYARNNNRIRFHITESSSEQLMDMVRQEKLDMAILDSSDRDRSLHFRKLRQRDFCVALPEGHPLAERKSLKVADLAGCVQIGFSHSMDKSFEDWANHPEIRQNFLCQVNTVSSALALVKAHVGVTILPSEVVSPTEGVTFLPLENRHQALYLCIVYDRWLEPTVWDFAEHLVKRLRKLS